MRHRECVYYYDRRSYYEYYEYYDYDYYYYYYHHHQPPVTSTTPPPPPVLTFMVLPNTRPLFTDNGTLEAFR